MNRFLVLLTTALFTASPLCLFAQVEGRSGVPGSQRPSTVPGPPRPAESQDLDRFDLDFPGGTPGALVLAISKATRKHLNVIIPNSYAKTEIMPIKVEKVTVPELFRAIETASTRQIPQVTSMLGPDGSRNIQYKSISLSFEPNSNTVTNETIWSFRSTAPTAEEESMMDAAQGRPEPNQLCQYFQLGPHLQDHSIEDITTAIQTGWKMLKVDPVPQLSFHEETKLLIAVGPADYVAQIPQVLQHLPLDNSVAVEKIAKLQTELAEVEAKKAGDWEKKAQEKREQIDRVAAFQKARETIQNSGQPRPVRTLIKQ